MINKSISSKDIIQLLGQSCAKGSVSLFLGAGVSKHFGLPDFSSLIEMMFWKNKNHPEIQKLNLKFNYYLTKTGKEEDYIPFETLNDAGNIESLPSLLKNKVFDGENSDFIQLVSECLYEDSNVDIKSRLSHFTLLGISSLIIASNRKASFPVFTLNFDDLLEIYLGYSGFISQSIYEEGQLSTHADVAVYHPHGLLPMNKAKKKSKNIVIGANDFSKLNSDKESFWFSAAVSVMATNLSVYIGLSGVDATLRHMMQDAYKMKNRNPYVVKNTPAGLFFTTKNSPLKNETLINDLAEYGVMVFFVDNYETHLPEILLASCKEATRIKEQFYDTV